MKIWRKQNSLRFQRPHNISDVLVRLWSEVFPELDYGSWQLKATSKCCLASVVYVLLGVFNLSNQCFISSIFDFRPILNLFLRFPWRKVLPIEFLQRIDFYLSIPDCLCVVNVEILWIDTIFQILVRIIVNSSIFHQFDHFQWSFLLI